MRSFVLVIFLTVGSATPVPAQEEPPLSLMERGAQQFLEGLLQEMEPALEGMMSFLEQMGPAMRDIMDEVKDWSVYEAPELLPNGDIIIRRKPDLPDLPEAVPDIADPPQIDL